METFVMDLRLAIRMLVKKPGFTAVAVLTLALGIAVNATIFSLVSAFLLRRPPVHEARRVVAVSSINPNRVFLPEDRKSTRLNSSHVATSYAVFCWKKNNPKRGHVS